MSNISGIGSSPIKRYQENFGSRIERAYNDTYEYKPGVLTTIKASAKAVGLSPGFVEGNFRAAQIAMPDDTGIPSEEEFKDLGYANIGIKYSPKYTREDYEILANYHKEKAKNQDILSRTDHDFIALVSGLLRGMVDPQTIAETMAMYAIGTPIAGIAKASAKTSKIANIVNKAMSATSKKAKIARGAGAGFAGEVANIPFSLAAGEVLQDELTGKDIATNLGLGGVFGSGLRTAGIAFDAGYNHVKTMRRSSVKGELEKDPHFDKATEDIEGMYKPVPRVAEITNESKLSDIEVATKEAEELTEAAEVELTARNMDELSEAKAAIDDIEVEIGNFEGENAGIKDLAKQEIIDCILGK